MSDLGLGTTQPPRSDRRLQSDIRRRRHRGFLAALVALIVVALLLGGGVYLGRGFITGLLPDSVPDYDGPGSGSVVIEIAAGESLSQIGTTLAGADVVASTKAFVNAADAEPDSTRIQPGHYTMRKQMSGQQAVTLLLDPSSRVVLQAVLPEGLRLSEALDALATATNIPLADFEAAAKDPSALGLPPYAHDNLEGFVFPATYEFAPDMTAAQILSATVVRYEQAATDADVESQSVALGITPYQAVIVASIIEAEAVNTDDYPRVARVIYNRLAAGMRLQMDSTVHYAVGDTGSVFTTDEERAVDSPYNTYRVTGLPPGPIGSPGDAALQAALHPANGTWLYFVTVNLDTGETRFATTAAEHQANVASLRTFCQSSDRC